MAAEEAAQPFEYCDVVSTTTHKSLRGPRAGMIFYRKVCPTCDVCRGAHTLWKFDFLAGSQPSCLSSGCLSLAVVQFVACMVQLHGKRDMTWIVFNPQIVEDGQLGIFGRFG